MNTICERLNHLYEIKNLDKNSLVFISEYEEEGDYVFGTEEEIKEMLPEDRYGVVEYATYYVCKLLLDYLLDGNKVSEQFHRCMRKCLKYEFAFFGYLGEFKTMDNIKHLVEHGLFSVIDSEEKRKLDDIVDSYRDMGETHPLFSSLKDLLSIYDRDYMFVYGTLMKENSNHHQLNHSEYVSDAVLSGYALLNLGYFPGAVRFDTSKVYGEVYKVHPWDRKDIDYLEKGLYDYKSEFVRIDEKLYHVGFYEYKRFTDIMIYPKCPPYMKWTNKKYVWYVCYGSNLNYERFMRYINQCEDKTAPIAKKTIILPYSVYLAGYAATWNGSKCFLDTKTEGLSYGIKYLITEEQYLIVKRKEGSDYKTEVELGNDEYGVRQITFTATSDIYEFENLSQSYLNTIAEGLRENYQFSEKEINKYLNEMIRFSVKRHKSE